MILPVSKGLTAYNFAWYGGMVVVLALFVYLGIPYGSFSAVLSQLVLLRAGVGASYLYGAFSG